MKKYFVIFFLVSIVSWAQDKNFEFKVFDENTSISKTEKALYFDRLDKINSINTIKIRKNGTVAKQVKRYLGFNHLPKTMGKAEYYFYYFQLKLKKYGLPEELKYLAIIESDLNPNAVSRVGAKGLWQFMPATGIQYGLYENDEISLFFDPIASTDAACRYLRDLYKKFNDWELVLAAYNCGPSRVSKAIKKAGKKDYWSIRHLLPKETNNYVPSFLAVQYVFNFYKDHNIKPRRIILKGHEIKTHTTKKESKKSEFYTTKKEQKIFDFLNPHLLSKTIPIRTRFYLKELPEKPVILHEE